MRAHVQPCASMCKVMIETQTTCYAQGSPDLAPFFVFVFRPKKERSELISSMSRFESFASIVIDLVRVWIRTEGVPLPFCDCQSIRHAEPNYLKAALCHGRLLR